MESENGISCNLEEIQQAVVLGGVHLENGLQQKSLNLLYGAR
jgi:hypothetical protein